MTIFVFLLYDFPGFFLPADQMGPAHQSDAVVDPRLRVHGINRFVSRSIFGASTEPVQLTN